MPQRILRDYTDSDAVNQLDAGAERFFVRLMMKADDYGLFTADKRLLRASLFPLLLNDVREADLDRWIAACVKASLVRLYEVAGKKYLEIVKFDQRLRTARAKHPFPPDADSNMRAGDSDGPDVDGGPLTDDGGLRTFVSNSRADDRNPPPDSDTDLDTDTEDATASKRARTNSFQPPSREDVRAYFNANGYRQEIADRAFDYYEAGAWKDSKGNRVRNWKQKMLAVWFKDENREASGTVTTNTTTAETASFAIMQPPAAVGGQPERWTVEEYRRLQDRTEYKLLRYE
ncbi:MAG: hypothetical protein EOP52_12445 [Sphingobacteriales bacterium]|nr:MAG: hypothetical protein EOP52_12445 [Sphingobacteriales bacterium]